MDHDTPPDPLDLAAHSQAAIAASQREDWGRAIAHLRVALAVAPQVAESWANLATAMQRIGRLDEADRLAQQAVALKPALAAAWNVRGLVAIDRGRHAEARAHLARALELDAGFALAHMNLGICEQAAGRDEAALASLTRALELDPTLASAHYNLGALHHKRGRHAQAIGEYLRAIGIRHGDAQSHFNLALALFATGQFDEAWRRYSWRAQRRDHAAQLRREGAGRIALVAEQGLGDNLFFLRFAPALRQRGATLDFVGDARLHPILARTGLFTAFARSLEELPHATRDVMLTGDVPSGMATPPPLELVPESTRVNALRSWLASLGQGPYIALAWRAGEPKSGRIENLYKETPLEALGGALRGVRATWLAIQRDPRPGELDQLSKSLGAPVHDFSAMNLDLEDALALLAACDAYAGVSSTLVHLAAGVGTRTLVAVPFPPEWRWMESGDTSPWFPRASVYRQAADGDWSAALARMARDLTSR
jgi:tetratricopeptide (TPR) repeat protein